MSTQSDYDFDWPTTVDLGTFTADFSSAVKSTIPKHGKNGDYTAEEWSVVVSCAKISNPLRINGISKRNFDRMRVLTLSGLKNLTVTRGMAAVGQPSSFAPYIISGVA